MTAHFRVQADTNMAKISSKIQPKQPSVTNLDNAALPAITTNQPASTTQTDLQASATCHSIFNFVTLMTPYDIKNFLNFAATTTEGQNLTHLWQCTYKYGYKNGKKSLLQNLERKIEEKFEEGVARGMGLGREEGYTVVKQGFDGIVKALKDREQLKKVSSSNFGTQMDSPHTTTTSISVQTNTTTLPIISQAQKFVENGVGTSLTPTVNFSIQTSPGVVHTLPLATFNDQMELLVPLYIKNDQKIESSPISTRKLAEPAVSTCIDWADDANTLPITPTSTFTHPPRDLLCLCSTMPHPFSSLRRKCGHPNRQWNAQCHGHGHYSNINSESSGYSFSRHHWHSSCSHTPFRAPASLDWNRDPQLANLSNALQALGWVRQ